MLAGRRVLVDASMATLGGGYTYLVNMVPALAAAAPDAKFLVLARNTSLAGATASASNVELRVLPESGLLGRIGFLAFRAAKLADRWRADVYLSVAEYAPLGAKCPAVIYLRNANVFTPLEQGWGRYQTFRLSTLRRLAIGAARRAARVIFVSRDSASWIGDAAMVPPHRRAVIHHGADVEAWRETIGARPRTGSTGILSLSSVYRYKNIVRLIEAYCVLAGRVSDLPPLTIVGDKQDKKHLGEVHQAIERAGELARQIRLVGEVPYEEVISYYQDAVLFVFPSYLETFGHPLLEAMAAELPVVASDIPVFREIAGEAAIYFDPFDVKELADGMERVLSDPELAHDLAARAHARAESFTWKAAADRLGALLEEVISES
jgi:glycosyltransferase involved in cell wall biosynthesis